MNGIFFSIKYKLHVVQIMEKVLVLYLNLNIFYTTMKIISLFNPIGKNTRIKFHKINKN